MITKFAEALKELFYPNFCLLCRNKLSSADDKNNICNHCLKTISINTPPFCQKCGRKIKGRYLTKSICAECRQIHYYFDRAWASCSYIGNVREMIHLFKYKNKLDLKKPLSKVIINFIESYFLPVNYCDYLIPMPLSSRKLREREFNQSELLAEEVSKRFNIKIVNNNLMRIKDTNPQAELDKSRRFSNIEGAFNLRQPEDIKDKIILLLDDVLTTGATASEAAKTLKNAGASVVFVIALAN